MTNAVEHDAIVHEHVFPVGRGRAHPTRLGVAVVHNVVELIVTGELKPGDTIPAEGVLAEDFGVSRTVIRESIKRLEEKGLVVARQGRGTRVSPTNDWNILDPVVLGLMIEHDDSLDVLGELIEVRADLEVRMTRAAAFRASSDDVGRLNSLFELMKSSAGDREGFKEADIRFHAMLMEISGSWIAMSIARNLIIRAMESDRYHGRVSEEGDAATIHEHEQILAAVAAGSPDDAADAMRNHIEIAWERRRLPSHIG